MNGRTDALCICYLILFYDRIRTKRDVDWGWWGLYTISRHFIILVLLFLFLFFFLLFYFFIFTFSYLSQVLGKVPTISIDKTDGCQMYLNSESLDVELITSKSSEMNVMVPKGNGDYVRIVINGDFFFPFFCFVLFSFFTFQYYIIWNDLFSIHRRSILSRNNLRRPSVRRASARSPSIRSAKNPSPLPTPPPK